MKRFINLLPPEEQRQIKFADTRSSVFRFAALFVFSLALLAAALFGAQFFLGSELRSAEADLSVRTQALHQLETAKVRDDVESFNFDLKNFSVMAGAEDHWSDIFAELRRVVPSGMTLDGVDVSPSDGAIKVEIRGRGGSRAAVLALRQNILSSELFSGVNFPLKNLERAKDAPWSYRFYVKQ